MEGLAYATCGQQTSDCLQAGSWDKVLIEGGWKFRDNVYAAPNHIFDSDNAVHVIYHTNGALKYAKCLLTSDCRILGKDYCPHPIALKRCRD